MYITGFVHDDTYFKARAKLQSYPEWRDSAPGADMARAKKMTSKFRLSSNLHGLLSPDLNAKKLTFSLCSSEECRDRDEE